MMKQEKRTENVQKEKKQIKKGEKKTKDYKTTKRKH